MIKLRILLLNQLKTVSPCVFVYVRMYVCVYEIAYLHVYLWYLLAMAYNLCDMVHMHVESN